MFDMDYDYFLEEDKMGMTITSGNITIKKDENNLIGISIGGGTPLCPCLYIVQIFDNTPAAKDGTLQSGDELIAVNGQTVKGKSKVEVAKMIQTAEGEVSINYNKLHADPKQGKSLDIVLKKVKHRLIENMSSSTADALGLSRAILCKDTLVKKLQELEDIERMYKNLVDHCKRVLVSHVELSQTVKAVGDLFNEIAVREPQQRASEVFRAFGEQHRNMDTATMEIVREIKPVIKDMGTYLYKAIPDTRLTVKKYADAKFEYLAYCLKVKEMDDEECSYASLQEPLYRVETGNYEYRLFLRCRQLARVRFAKLRSDVLVKMELLDNKHLQSLGGYLSKLINGFVKIHSQHMEVLSGPALFPVEVDLSNNAFRYKSITPVSEFHDEEYDELSICEEVKEDVVVTNRDSVNDLLSLDIGSNVTKSEEDEEPNYDEMDNLTLLKVLNLEGQKLS